MCPSVGPPVLNLVTTLVDTSNPQDVGWLLLLCFCIAWQAVQRGDFDTALQLYTTAIRKAVAAEAKVRSEVLAGVMVVRK